MLLVKPVSQTLQLIALLVLLLWSSLVSPREVACLLVPLGTLLIDTANVKPVFLLVLLVKTLVIFIANLVLPLKFWIMGSALVDVASSVMPLLVLKFA